MYLGVTIHWKLHWTDRINIKSKANKQFYFVRRLGQFQIDKTLITLFYKFVIENILSICIPFGGGNSSKGERMKVDGIIKISETAQSMPLIWKNYTIKIHYVKGYQSQKTYLNKYKSNCIDGHNIMTKKQSDT